MDLKSFEIGDEVEWMSTGDMTSRISWPQYYHRGRLTRSGRITCEVEVREGKRNPHVRLYRPYTSWLRKVQL